jgi:hypothetical protein
MCCDCANFEGDPAWTVRMVDLGRVFLDTFAKLLLEAFMSVFVLYMVVYTD